MNYLEKVMKNHLFQHYYGRYMMLIGVLGQFLFYFQAWKIFTHKSAQSLSFPGFMISFISVTSWMIYGILLNNKVIFYSNLVAVVGAALVLIGIKAYG